MIRLIITADDFGYRDAYDKMILELIKEGDVTSTSVMIDHIKKKEQIEELINYHDNVSIGLHIFFKNTDYIEEIDRQYNKFISIFGFPPSHLDIHKMDHLKEGYPRIQEFCLEKNIPCKNLSLFDENIMLKDVKTTKETLFDATKRSFVDIIDWLDSLKEGIYCINFHPGYYDPESPSSLNKEREDDAKNIRKIVEILPQYDIGLTNFSELS